MSKQTAGREGLAAFFLRQRGRLSKQLSAAIELTPRDQFLPAQWQNFAWTDRMVPIECGEAVEGIDLQAAVISALNIEPAHRVLEIGTGTGYTAALMARLSARVTTVDRYKTLCENARQRFEALQLSGITVRHADGSNGLASQGPYDRIVVWASFESLPRTFVDQLATNGVMVTPIGPPEDEQDLTRLSKVGSRFEREDFARVRLQPIARSISSVI